MDDKEGIKIPLRLHVHKEKNRVIFAEANSDFVDTLSSFLTLPMGTIPGEIGCFGNLYESVEKLDDSYLWSGGCKQMLLNPINVAGLRCRRLKLNVDDSSPTKYLVCPNYRCDNPELSLNSFPATCSCGSNMREPSGITPSMSTDKDEGKGGAFITETASFIVTDELHVLPNLPTTVFQLFEKLGISDLDAVDEINLDIGYKEILTLLKCSLLSNSPLTSTFASKGSNYGCLVNYEMGNLSQNGRGKAEEPAETALTIKLVIQKSNNKLLFAHGEENFVDFLFSLLTIPLGGVARLLSGNISFGSVGNLYNSISTLKLERHLKSQELREVLLNPQLAALHLSKNHLLSFPDAEVDEYYRLIYKGYCNEESVYVARHQINCYSCVKLSLKDPKFKGQYTRPSMFIVTADMHVSPVSSFSVVSYLQRLGIPLSDVEKQNINIGMAEAQKILKAAIESNSFLTNECVNSMLKPIKQEHI